MPPPSRGALSASRPSSTLKTAQQIDRVDPATAAEHWKRLCQRRLPCSARRRSATSTRERPRGRGRQARDAAGAPNDVRPRTGARDCRRSRALGDAMTQHNERTPVGSAFGTRATRSSAPRPSQRRAAGSGMLKPNEAAPRREDGTAIVSCRYEDADGCQIGPVVIIARPPTRRELDQLGTSCGHVHPSSRMAMPACQILVMCPILSPSKFIT
jgi:hypothetical protein